MYRKSPSRQGRRNRPVGSDVRQPVGLHEEDHRNFLRRHRNSTAVIDLGNRTARNNAGRELFSTSTNSRALACAFDSLARNPYRAPGPNGLRITDFDEETRWELVNTIKEAIDTGNWVTGLPEVQQIPKASGNGTRPIEIFNIEDMIIQTSVSLTLEPFLDPQFDEHSFGWRSSMGSDDALIVASEEMTRTNCHVCIVQDIKDMYTNIPHERLWDALRVRGIQPDMIDLIRRSIPTNRQRGVPQGACHAPLLANVYLDHFLDRPWRRRHPDVPLIRFADDLLVIIPAGTDAEAVWCDLEGLIRSAGLESKHQRNEAIVQWGIGQPIVNWLGFRLQNHGNNFVVQISENNWRSLDQKVEERHRKPDSPLRALDTLAGWLNYLGPCLQGENVERVYARVSQLMRCHGFSEFYSENEFRELWERAYARFSSLRSLRHLISAWDDYCCCGFAQQPTTGETARFEGAPARGAPSSFSDEEADYLLFTDGSCLRRNQRGGWACLLRVVGNGFNQWTSGASDRTTNNRMELTAVIKGLEAIERPSRIVVFSDSRYVVDGLNTHLQEWQSNRWRRRSGGIVSNADLWLQLSHLVEYHLVRFEWVRGHSGHPENEFVDQLANDAAMYSQ